MTLSSGDPDDTEPFCEEVPSRGQQHLYVARINEAETICADADSDVRDADVLVGRSGNRR